MDREPSIMKPAQVHQLLDVASHAAVQAGQFIAQFDRSAIEVERKLGGSSVASQVVTQVDTACEAIIHQLLEPTFDAFDIAFLGEESAASYPIDQHPRLIKPYFWCVDPLDGTLPFTENVAGYAVSIALVERSGKPIFGVVYDPCSATLYQGMAKHEALVIEPLLLRQGLAWQPELGNNSAELPLTLLFDRSFTKHELFTEVVRAMEAWASQAGFAGINVEHQAGSVINAIRVLERAPACYFKFPKAAQGGGSLWDFAATAAIANAAGAWASDIHGDVLALNQADSLYMNRRGAAFASSEQLAQQVMALFASLSQKN